MDLWPNRWPPVCALPTITARFSNLSNAAKRESGWTHFLLRENDTKRFGAFGIDGDGDIFFEHSIVGSTCDKEELRASTLAVSQTADLFDEQIIQRWGGMRGIDRAKEQAM